MRIVGRLTVTKSNLLLIISVSLNFILVCLLVATDTQSVSRELRQRSITVKRANFSVVITDESNLSREIATPWTRGTLTESVSLADTLSSGTPRGLSGKPEAELEPTPMKYMLAVLILTAPGNFNRRNIIRNTWKNGYQKRKFFIRFVIGAQNLKDDIVEQLQNENLIHNDILLLPHTEDYYQNLAHKVLASLVWFDANVNYSYLFKCDDDTFALLDKIEDELHQRDHSQGLYWGYFIGNNYPARTGIWAETNWKFCDTYFPYALGGGYVLSADVVKQIAVNADKMIVYKNEDVSVGAWTVIYDIERKHDVRFDTGEARLSRGCRNRYLVFHKQSEMQMREKHEQYTKSGVMCKEEQPSLAKEQEYNWNMPPSRCYDMDEFSQKKAKKLFKKRRKAHSLPLSV